MTIVTTATAIDHCRADPVVDSTMMSVYLAAAEEAAQDYLCRKVYADEDALSDANDDTGMVANPTFRAAVLLICGHLYANRESVLVGAVAQILPMGAHELLRPYRRVHL